MAFVHVRALLHTYDHYKGILPQGQTHPFYFILKAPLS